MTRTRARIATAAAIVSIAAVAGCGLGPGRGTSDVTMTVTRDFGSHELKAVTESKVPGSETVMRMLERHFTVSTRYGGGFVESIDGASGNASRTDWFYYVNGIEAAAGAANTAVHKGDHVWWDLHDWAATNSIPAVVGSYPEPFVNGSGGKRFPTAVECGSDVSSACKLVQSQLDKQGVPSASQFIGSGSGQDTFTVVVGTWKDLRALTALALIQNGPGSSGVYARFAPSGDAIELLDPDGRTARTLTGTAGLIAATADTASEPTWLITGTNTAGVLAAAHALTPGALHDHFALAVSPGAQIPVPVGAG